MQPVVTRGSATFGVSHDMMELEKAGFAAATLLAAKRTLTHIAAPHLTLDGCWNVARAARRLPTGPWTIRRSELRFLN